MISAGSLEGAPARSRLLKEWALEAGFDRAGVARLEPSEYGETFRRWLERGDQAGMAYLERRLEERLDPARLLPAGRSALCVALHYHALGRSAGEPGGDDLGEDLLWGRVARYARGDDYHDGMRRRLDALAARIREAFPGTQTRPYVDTGPILERELAQRAGLGRIGKNTNLLHREGSWFLIGELLLTLELEPDEPLADMCGQCTRCLDACPTGALPEPYRLDSRRCISYWTIEHRGVIPEEARAGLHGWVFGCDVCQEVCPWNQATPVFDHPELELPERRRRLGLADLLCLSRDDYVEQFQRSPMKRSKLGGLKRNAALALARQPDEASRRALEEGLLGPDPEVRLHVVWALGQLLQGGGGPKLQETLKEALWREGAPRVRSEILGALMHSRTAEQERVRVLDRDRSLDEIPTAPSCRPSPPPPLDGDHRTVRESREGG